MIISRPNVQREVPGKASQFTGLASGDVVLPTTDGVTINTVTFAPGARTHWHTHSEGQILFVKSGYGLICTAGEEPQPIREGDTVWIPAGERHWHGASPDSFMAHTAVSFGPTQWSDEVSHSEYPGHSATKDTE